MVYHNYELASNKTSISNGRMQRGFWASGPITLTFISLCLLLIFRFEYLFWNWSEFSQIDSSQIMMAFVHGLRFDLTVTTWIVALFWLLYFVLPLTWARNARLIVVFYLLLQLPFVVINSIDIVLFNFTGKRMTTGNFYLFKEVSGRFEGIIGPYIVPMLLQICMLLGVYYLVFMSTKPRPVFPYPLNWKKHLAFSFIALALLIIAGRGGLQRKPITFANAQVFSDARLNNLVLNSTFTVVKTLSKNTMPKFKYYSSSREYAPYLNFQASIARAPWAKDIHLKEKTNVVLLVVESLSLEYMSLVDGEVSYTPFLDELAKKSLFFTNGYANARRSIEGIGAIFAGVPALMDEPFISSEFATNPYEGMGTIFLRQGYDTSFFHGVMNGTMYFDAFMPGAGVKNYFGLNEFPHKDSSNFDGTWGIFDEPYLSYVAEKLRETPEPFFTSIFTLSSHQPYTLPPEYIGKFQKGPIPLLESMQYADLALKKFFAEIEKQSWSKNTLFIITGDHTGESFKPNFTSDVGRYRVPILFYMKNAPWKPQRVDDIAQHIDLIPTLKDMFFNDQGKTVRLAQSLLRPHEGKHFLSYLEGRYLYVDKDNYAVGSDPSELQVFELQDASAQLSSSGDAVREKILRRTRADMQYFSEALWDQRLYDISN